MSHVAKVKTNIKIKNLDILEKACKKIGLQLNLNQKNYKWYGRHVGDYPVPEGMTIADLGKCNHAISIPNNHNAYEVGVIEKKWRISVHLGFLVRWLWTSREDWEEW